MRVCENGTYRDMTQEEVKRYEELCSSATEPHQPSVDERLTTVEYTQDDILAVIADVLGGALS